MSHVLPLYVQLLWRLVLIGEIDTASDSLLLALLLSISLFFELLDSENLDDTLGSGWLFLDLLLLCGAIEDCLDFWFGHECLLLWSHVCGCLLLDLAELLHIEMLNFPGLQRCCVKLNLEDRV